MSTRRSRRTAITIATVSVSGGALLGASLFTLPPLTTDLLVLAGVLVVVTAIAEMMAIGVTHGDEGEMLTLFELAVVADIVLLPASVAVVVSALGLAVALAIGRKPFVKFAFNIGQYSLGVVPAVMAFHTFGGGDFTSSEGLIALVGGMTVFTFINLATISWIIAATTNRSMETVFREEGGLSLAMGLGNSAVGVVAVALWLTRPVLIVAVLAPALAMHLAFRGWVKQKELLGQMREEQTKLVRILEHSTEGIVLADADGIVLLWSPSMERITGVPAVEAHGKALPYLLRGRDAGGQPVAVGVEQASGEPTEIEVIAADGTGRWLRLLHGPGYDESGSLSFDVLVIHDVTRQREVDRLKDDFISTVSHELRTPLTPIKAFASLLLRRGHEIDESRRREALSSIVERSDHMHRLVEDLLLASRMANPHERRLPEIERRPVDAAAVGDKTLRAFRISHPTRDFHLTSDEGVVAMADPLRLEQIVANLVSNAVKFSEEGTRIDIDIARADHDIRLRVHDQGRGIPADRMEEIFERFTRLEDPLRMTTGGAGLGLFIVKRLAQALGGSVSVESEVGTGSTFTVLLPAAAQRAGTVATELAG
jgi:PAS domain S-box-containing protein